MPQKREGTNRPKPKGGQRRRRQGTEAPKAEGTAREARARKREAARWAEETFGAADLGDARRTRRLVTLATDLAASTGASLSRASGHSEAAVEGAYRFVRNERVDPERAAEAGFGAAAARAALAATLLAVEDTTTLSYRHAAAAAELGDLGGPKESEARGFLVHSSLLLDADSGATVGLIDQQYWKRDPAQRGKKHRRHERPYEEKESFKWQRTAERVRQRLGKEVLERTVAVCDREADVYEYLSYKVQHQERFVVRAAWDRKVEADAEEEQAQEAARLFALVGRSPVYGTVQTVVAQRGGRARRSATLTLRAMRVRLRRPPRPAGSELPTRLAVNAVLAREECAPAGVEPLEWLLFTREPIDTAEQVLRVVHYYRLRWRIEEFHKAWKSGAGVERRRMQAADNLQRVAVLLAFVAVRLLQLRETLERCPEAACDEVLTTAEWKVLWVAVEKKRPPRRVPSVQWAYRAIGRLGGWHDSKRTGRMGWESYWNGWNKLRERMEGYEAALLVNGNAS